MEEKNEKLMFSEDVKYMVEDFGKQNQDGIKFALNRCQDIFGCVSKADQEEIANAFEVDIKIVKTLIKLSRTLKESIVEYEIICCSGSRCAKNGSVEVLKEVRKTLGIDFGETSDDGRIRLTTQNCFKKCGEGPNMMINGVFHHKLDKEKTRKILEGLK